ncbi:MAG TPA: hypothetical protein VJR03_11965 [Nitrospira sp.]|nr:hypothetical protein [Nitrospira sp.]
MCPRSGILSRAIGIAAFLLLLQSACNTETSQPAVPSTAAAATPYDNFNGPLYTLTSDGVLTPNGLWKTGFVSQGFVETVQDPTNVANQYLVTSPALDVLRASRLDTTNTWPEIHGSVRARLDVQLQPPLGWYTIWPLIAFVNDTTHYYFNLKTNGWELGKKDNDHPPTEELQEFLATGNSPNAVIGQWNTIEWWVTKDTASTNLRIRVDVNGMTVVDMVDNQPWQRNGTIGTGTSSFFLNAVKGVSLYNEGSQVSWDDVFISAPATN